MKENWTIVPVLGRVSVAGGTKGVMLFTKGFIPDSCSMGGVRIDNGTFP